MNRSANMRAIRSKNTAPELFVRSLLHRLGYRFRLHAKDLPGKPDIILRPRRAVIFVHGCFWHGHACVRGGRMPKTNAAYWESKIARNKLRDSETVIAVEAAGYRCLTLWECGLKDQTALESRLKAFLTEKSVTASPAPS
jgi:DNA mismatch endonuclease, patch repair protein